ncbi:MAG: B12-binding domain-containing radical SAM protein [Campylobacteraceae bacterium]|nr:B12-binding domain-containing radical SAM protein [Campylobacteraceae bacterium]
MTILKQADLKKQKQFKAVLIGISGAHNSFCLSLYNLKSFAYSDPIIHHNWSIEIIQEPLITELDYETRIEILIKKIMKHSDADLFGFSCYMWNMKYVNKLCDILKIQSPFSKIVLGGPEISKDWIIKGLLNNLTADYLVFGEGEKSFNEILKSIQNNESKSKINGIAFKENENWIVNAQQIPFKSLLDIPSPYISGCIDDEILIKEDIQANIETQRGCSLRCSYCIYHKDMPNIVYGGVERVLAEVDYISNKGCKRIRFVDANFTSNINYTKDIMRGLISRKIEATIFAELIPGFIDEELANLFKEFNDLWEWNYITLGVGVQSINIDALRRVKRKIAIEKFDETFELLSSRGIYAKIDIILGLPGEDILSIANTQEYMLNKLKKSKAHLLCCHTMRGLPGTDLYNLAQQFQMHFSSEREPHELIESPILPRQDMVHVLRRTAIIFRIINPGFSKSHDVRKKFYETVEKLLCSHLDVIDQLINIMLKDLPSDSWFAQDDFPYAETWWWECSAHEVSDQMIIEWLKDLTLPNNCGNLVN